MYWLLDNDSQQKIRDDIDELVSQLSTIKGNPQSDQLFPYVGRKDRRKAIAAIKVLTKPNDLIVEPFAGSGSLVYAIWQSKRICLGNEWEPYACRMSNAPWRIPDKDSISSAIKILSTKLDPFFSFLYQTTCSCGHKHTIDTQFFDRIPLKYKNITKHERLGPNGETITFRQSYRCPKCGRTEKFFDKYDAVHLKKLNNIAIPNEYRSLFNTRLIENSRINLSKEFLVYYKLFPKRSILALCKLATTIEKLKIYKHTKDFLFEAFLSILPQAKFKDYRSKSQDLHCPPVQLREVNIWYRFLDQVTKRLEGLINYNFPKQEGQVIACKDFRDFMAEIKEASVDLVFTDPPWTDGNAYFEKAQLYHPWIRYNLSKDKKRLLREFVVTDAPTRKNVHDIENWWKDMEEFLRCSCRILKPKRYLALFFRPIPAAKWLSNLNRLKLIARRSGLEPLLSIDVESADPSMRIQQSASYVFSQDIIFIFTKLPVSIRRHFFEDTDIDQLVFQAAERIQEKIQGPFTFNDWRNEFSSLLSERAVEQLNAPKYEKILFDLFNRYCDEISPGKFLPKASTPFSSQLFDIPAIERLFTYTPLVIRELLKNNDRFNYDRFLLKLSEYVENGTRELINQIEHIDIKATIEPYATPMDDGRWFKKRPEPKLPDGLRNVLEMEPYDFEAFVGKLLEALNFTSIGLVGRSGDRGVDLTAIDPNGIATVVQCKRYFQHNVSASPVQRLHSFAITRGAKRKILITTSGFTKQAEDEARNTNTELINGPDLEILIAKHLPDFFR